MTESTLVSPSVTESVPDLNRTQQSEQSYSLAARVHTVEWIVAQSLAAIATIFAMYLVTALLHYEMKKRGIISTRSVRSDYSVTETEYEGNTRINSSPAKTNMQTNADVKSNRQVHRIRRSKPSHEERYETWLRLLNLNAAWFAMLKCFSIQIDLFGGTYSSSICTGYAFSTIMFNGTSFLSVYLLLWLRQWAVHSHPALKHLPVKKLRLVSWILLAAILALFASLCVLFFLTIR